jgi:hypothetical protein
MNRRERKMQKMRRDRTRLLLLTLLGLAVTASVSTALGANPPMVTFNPSTYDFGAVAVGSTVSKTFTLTNAGGKTTGTVNVTLSDARPDLPTTFSKTADSCTGTKLAPRKSCSVTVRYAPTASGVHNAAQLLAFDTKPTTGLNATANITGGASTGCALINSTGQGLYERDSGEETFRQGETLTVSAADPNQGVTPTGISLTVTPAGTTSSVPTDTDGYPGTVQYTFPASGTYDWHWEAEPAGSGATWTATCG